MSSLVKKIKDVLWGKGVISTPRIAQKRSGKVLYLSHLLNFLSIFEVSTPPKISLYKWAKSGRDSILWRYAIRWPIAQSSLS